MTNSTYTLTRFDNGDTIISLLQIISGACSVYHLDGKLKVIFSDHKHHSQNTMLRTYTFYYCVSRLAYMSIFSTESIKDCCETPQT